MKFDFLHCPYYVIFEVAGTLSWGYIASYGEPPELQLTDCGTLGAPTSVN